MKRNTRRIVFAFVSVLVLSASPGMARCWTCVWIPGVWGQKCIPVSAGGPGKTACNDRNYTCRLYRDNCNVEDKSGNKKKPVEKLPG